MSIICFFRRCSFFVSAVLSKFFDCERMRSTLFLYDRLRKCASCENDMQLRVRNKKIALQYFRIKFKKIANTTYAKKRKENYYHDKIRLFRNKLYV